MGNVTVCKPVELVFVDPARLAQLSGTRGGHGAAAIAGVALEEIVMRLAAVEAAWRQGEVSRLCKLSRSLVGLSSEIGLVTLSEVARYLAHEAERTNPIAIDALVARLVRVGSHSVSAIGDLDHLRV